MDEYTSDCQKGLSGEGSRYFSRSPEASIPLAYVLLGLLWVGLSACLRSVWLPDLAVASWFHLASDGGLVLLTAWFIHHSLKQIEPLSQTVSSSGGGVDAIATLTAQLKELQENQHRYQIVAELTSDYTYSARISSTGELSVEWITEPFGKISGYTLAEIREPESWMQLIHPDDLACFAPRSRQLLSGQVSVNEFRIVTKQGEVRWLHDVAQPKWDEAEQRVVRIYGVARDVTDRKAAEVSLRRSEEFRRLAMDVTNTGSWDWHLATDDGIIWDTNHFLLLGLEPDDKPAYSRWRSHVHPEDVDRVERAVAHALENHADFKAEYRVIHPDGSVHWLVGKGRGIYNEAGEAVRMVGVLFDISDRKQAEENLKRLNEELEQRVEVRTRELHQVNQQLQAEVRERQQTEVALRQSEELFRQIFESAPVGMALASAQNYQFKMVNPAFCEMLGYSQAELMTGSCPSISHPEDLLAEQSLSQQLLKGEIPSYQFVKRYIKKNGETMWGSLTTRSVCNPAGEILYILGIVDDITHIKQVEDALAQRTVELESIINNMPDYIFVVERESMRLTLCNEMFVCGLGYRDQAEIYGKTIFDCFSPEAAHYFLQQNQQVFESERPLHLQETLALPDGEHHFETFKIPLRRSNGEVYALLAISRDYTELIETQRALSARTAQLEASNRELDSFSYSVSHDLRAPLRHIGGFVNALATRLEQNNCLDDPKINHYLQVIQTSSSKMGQLIDGLLTLSRVGRRQMAQLRVDLNAVVQSVLTQWTETNGSNSDSRNVEFEVGQLPIVDGDVTLLQQVFANLVENAVKFSRGRQPARIEIGMLPDNETIFVRDNGVGFSMEYADQLFGAFQRLHPQSEFEGTGIGLAIVQRIINRHGGMIWAESQPDRGSTFYFNLSGKANRSGHTE